MVGFASEVCMGQIAVSHFSGYFDMTSHDIHRSCSLPGEDWQIMWHAGKVHGKVRKMTL